MHHRRRVDCRRRAGAARLPSLLFAVKKAPLCVYAFDLLELQGRDIRSDPLVQCRARLKSLLTRGYSRLIRHSESFSDPVALHDSMEPPESEDGLPMWHKPTGIM